MSRSVCRAVGLALAAVPLSMVLAGGSVAQDLQSFAIVSGQSLTNTGPTTIGGNIAVSPGTSYTGSGSVTQIGKTFLTDAVAGQIQNDLTTLYNVLAKSPTSDGGDLTGKGLGGMTLKPGVYNFDTSADLAMGEILTLDAGGDPKAVFILNIGSTLIAGSGSSVVLKNGAQAGNVFYRVGSSATLGTSASLEGQIVALTSITLNTTAKIVCGAAMARNGSVTLDTNTIQICTLDGRGFETVRDDPKLTEGDRNAARALSEFVAKGGVLPVGLAVLAATHAPDAPVSAGLDLPGEVATGVAPMVMQAMDAFLDTVMRSGHTPRVALPPARGEGVPIGMVREQINAPYAGKYGPVEQADSGEQPLAFGATVPQQARLWDVWASAYGSRSVIDGDADWQERTSENRGLAVGLNFAPRAGLDFGIAVSKNNADFDLANDFGSGTSDTMFVALRGRASTEQAYVEGALSYGRSDISTDRTGPAAGAERLTGETTATSSAAHIEAGYHMGIFTPFAGLRAQSSTTQAFTEAGTSSFALRYDEQTTTSLRSELGVAMQWPADPSVSGVPVIGVRAAWARELASNDPGSRSFVGVPDTAFTASGTTRDRDSLILAASAGVGAATGLYLDGAVNAQYARDAQDFGGSVTVGYRW